MVRLADPSDIPRMLDIYAPYIRSTTVTFEYEVPTLAEFTQRFYGITESFPWLVYEEAGRVLGYAYASLPFERAAYRWCAEPSIYLDPGAQGRGIGKILYGILEDLLFRMGYRVLYAVITGENSRSLRFHEKLGYRQCGLFRDCGLKFGRLLDVYWLEKSTNSVEIPSISPIPWPEFRDHAQSFGNYLGKMSLPEMKKV